MNEILTKGMAAIKSQRKFTLALLFTVTGCIALFTDKMSGGEFSALAVLVLGAYGVANVMDKS